MKIFGINEAFHYCKEFSSESGISEDSILDFTFNHMSSQTLLREGTQYFKEYRACSLRNVERYLFLAASHYRRFLDLLYPSSSHWAYVTAYYGTFYSAYAILGMFGGGYYGKFCIGVKSSTIGKQELIKKKVGIQRGNEYTTYNGSHDRFWDIFYKSTATLKPVIPPHLVPALNPVNGIINWQTTNRNRVNYDTFEAFTLGEEFLRTYSKSQFPSCLSGVLGTQYGIFETMLELAFYFADQFNLKTDVYSLFRIPGNRKVQIRKLVYDLKRNELTRFTKKDLLIK